MNRNTNGTRRTNIKWTAEEEDIIIDEIGKNPTNLKACFMAAAELLPIRSYYACANHWYSKMAGRNDVVGKLTVGRYTTVRNKTRLKADQYQTHTESYGRNIWQKLIKLLFHHE